MNATMIMESMPFLDSDKERMGACLESKVDFDEGIIALIGKYTHKKVV